MEVFAMQFSDHRAALLPLRMQEESVIEYTVIGYAIPPRRPHRSTRSLLIRAMLECGPFLAAFDAGMCDE